MSGVPATRMLESISARKLSSCIAHCCAVVFFLCTKMTLSVLRASTHASSTASHSSTVIVLPERRPAMIASSRTASVRFASRSSACRFASKSAWKMMRSETNASASSSSRCHGTKPCSPVSAYVRASARAIVSRIVRSVS